MHAASEKNILLKLFGLLCVVLCRLCLPLLMVLPYHAARADVLLVDLVPKAAVAGEPVAIRISLGPYDYDLGFYSERSGNIVRGYLTLNDVAGPPQAERTRDCPIGSFAPGRYTIEFYVNGGTPVLVGTRTLVVSPIAAPTLNAPLTIALLLGVLAVGLTAVHHRKTNERSHSS